MQEEEQRLIQCICRSSHEERGLKSAEPERESDYQTSLLSRGAWIEIKNDWISRPHLKVAPLTRSVDWNPFLLIGLAYSIKSLLSRGAWIEILGYNFFKYSEGVAPLTRSVDWNCDELEAAGYWVGSLLSRGAWIEITTHLRQHVRNKSLLSRGAWIEIDTNTALRKQLKGRSSHEERGLKFKSLQEQFLGV